MTRKLLCMVALASGVMLHAVGARAIQTSAFLLVNPINARAVAMGEIGAADNSDPSTIFFNPANVCAESRFYGIGAEEHFNYFDGFWLRSANTGFSWQSQGRSSWMIGVDAGYTRLHLGNTEVRNDADSLVQEVDTYQDVASITVGAGFKSDDQCEVRLGLGVKMWREQFASDTDVKVDATTLDLGVAVTFHERYGAWNIIPAVGISAMDLGHDIEFPNLGKEHMPSRFNFGTSVRVESSPCGIFSARVPLVAFLCEADAIAPKDGGFEWGIGNEVAIAQILFVRAGVHRYATEDTNDFLNPDDPTIASWGIGLGIPAGPLRARFDYGRQPPPSFLGSTIVRDHMNVLVEWTF